MKVGMTLQLTSFGNKPDEETYQDELNLMEMAEGFGFDSVWALHDVAESYATALVYRGTYQEGATGDSGNCVAVARSG